MQSFPAGLHTSSNRELTPSRERLVHCGPAQPTIGWSPSAGSRLVLRTKPWPGPSGQGSSQSERSAERGTTKANLGLLGGVGVRPPMQGSSRKGIEGAGLSAPGAPGSGCPEDGACSGSQALASAEGDNEGPLHLVGSSWRWSLWGGRR